MGATSLMAETQQKDVVNVYLRGGVGYGIYDKAKIDGETLSKRSSNSMAKEIALEVTTEVYPNLEVGGGIAYQLHGEPEDVNHESIKYQMPNIESIPLYFTAKYKFKTFEEGGHVYVKGDLGYSFNDNKNDAKLYEDNIGLDVYTRVKHGAYAGVGIGLEKGNIHTDLMYKFNQIKVKIADDSTQFNSHRVMLSVGYKF